MKKKKKYQIFFKIEMSYVRERYSNDVKTLIFIRNMSFEKLYFKLTLSMLRSRCINFQRPLLKKIKKKNHTDLCKPGR